MEGLTFRKATAADTDRIAEIIHGEPGQEATAICGCEEGARAFGMAMVRLPDSPQGWRRTVVGEMSGAVVAVLQAGHPPFELQVTPQLLGLALRSLGVSVITAYPRWRARMRVQVAPPGGSYHVEELHVDSSCRNRGIGGALLGYAEAEARERRHRLMSLSTTTINPARRLYERHGFRVVETRTDRAYEKHTGIAGRHLMVKELS